MNVRGAKSFFLSILGRVLLSYTSREESVICPKIFKLKKKTETRRGGGGGGEEEILFPKLA